MSSTDLKINLPPKYSGITQKLHFLGHHTDASRYVILPPFTGDLYKVLSMSDLSIFPSRSRVGTVCIIHFLSRFCTMSQYATLGSHMIAVSNGTSNHRVSDSRNESAKRVGGIPNEET